VGNGRYVDTGAIRAALEAKGAADCPICGEVDSGIPLRSTLIPIPGVVPIGGTDPNPPEGLEAVCVTCQNCGFIRMHEVQELFGAYNPDD
jgi:hypothetical protein